MDDRRQFPRISIICGAMVITGGKLRIADIMDISQGGALIKFHDEQNDVQDMSIKPGTEIELDFFDRKAKTKCDINATVVRTFHHDHHVYTALAYNDTGDMDIKSILVNHPYCNA